MDCQEHGEQNAGVSMLEGEGFRHLKRILSRDSNVGGSSRIYYRRGEGVPFKWERQPGTPNNPPGEEAMPPLSPPPLIQSMGLPKPSVVLDDDDDDDEETKESKHWEAKYFWKKLKKLRKNHEEVVVDHEKGYSRGNRRSLAKDDIHLNDHKNGRLLLEMDSDGEFVGSFKNSSSSSSSSSSSFSLRNQSNFEVNSSKQLGRVSEEGPFCCNTPWNISTILGEGNAKIYYCRIHKMAFAPEAHGRFTLSKVLSRASSVDQSTHLYYRDAEGIPFQWEMEPGKPLNQSQNEIIPPPSPPPAMLSSTLPKPRPCLDTLEKSKASKWSRIWLWIIKNIKLKQKNDKRVQESSFRYDKVDYSSSDEEIEMHFCSPVSLQRRVSRLPRFKSEFIRRKFIFHCLKIKAIFVSSSRKYLK